MMTRRLVQLFAGLWLYGLSMALLIRAHLGLNPWDVFHQGVSSRTDLSIGTVVIIVGALVLLLWIPLRQRPGIGTIANIFVIGIAVDVSLQLTPIVDGYPLRISMLLLGILLNGVAGGMYIGAGLGPGPRDGLMTGIVRRTGHSVRLVRTGIELVVLGTGWLLGGTVGLGTLLYAISIGPIVQRMLPIFTIGEEPRAAKPVAAE
jgi:uncharacterized membrane protein YczE